MSEIVLTTLNAKYIHAAFGLRYLLANLDELRPRAALAEFDINQQPLDIAEKLLALAPKIIGFGVYIWNTAQTAQVLAAIKRVRPEITVILGGPEVSFETEQQAVVQLADHVITGEADLKFAEVCRQMLAGRLPGQKIIAAAPPTFEQLALPYELYTDSDLAHRVIYVEASRGCPFSCEFCLSSLDIPVRQAPLPTFLNHLDRLLERGARQFKFVDRTFNLNLKTSAAILEFCRTRWQPGRFFHFEMIPDRLPENLRKLIAEFPPGALQFEVGVQSFNPEVCVRISRRQNFERLEDNFHFLRQETGVHIHADLILGLPGESLESIAAGFDRLVRLGPQEIQVGILKRLRGTPIMRHDAEWEMVYHAHPPYEILQNKLLDFSTLQRLRRFARYWDLVGNSGNFVETTPFIWQAAGLGSPLAGTDETPALASPFWSFLKWSDWLYAQVRRTDGIALSRLVELLFRYLTAELGQDASQVAAVLWRDYQRGGRSDKPAFLRPYIATEETGSKPSRPATGQKRQARHWQAG